MADAERMYMETLIRINDRLQVLSNITQQSTSSSSGAQNIQVVTRAEIPLPPMTIPTFTGKSVDWMEFIALFTANILDKDRLTNSQKFLYLKSKLDGEAGKNFPVTDANYPIALAALTARYQNARLIAYAHLKALFGISAVKVETSSSLRRLIDATNDGIRALNGLNIDTAKTRYDNDFGMGTIVDHTRHTNYGAIDNIHRDEMSCSRSRIIVAANEYIETSVPNRQGLRYVRYATHRI